MLQITDLTVTYPDSPGDRPAVRDVDLRVDAGEVVAVLGPSGCGKSTLLRTVAGLERPSRGSVAWDGVDLAHTPTHRRGFALMFQDGQLFDHLSVARNVGYALRLQRGLRQGLGRSTERARVAELLDLVGLAGHADRMPRTLSGGERQRVALARSLAGSPRLLLLDEPLSSLDAELRVRLAADLRRILTESETPALLVTHDQGEAFAVADRIALMREGQVVQQGPTAEVWARPVDADAARFLGCTTVLEGAPAAELLRAAGSAESIEGSGALGLRPSALRATPATPASEQAPPGVVRARVGAFRLTPDGGRLVVSLPGIGDVDALPEPGWTPRPGDAADVEVDAGGLARIGRSTPERGADPVRGDGNDRRADDRIGRTLS